VVIKYEWRATLCRMNVIHCGTTYGRPHNRLWDDYGFAPPAGEAVRIVEQCSRGTQKGRAVCRPCLQAKSKT
jgi:hypothetical protein